MAKKSDEKTSTIAGIDIPKGFDPFIKRAANAALSGMFYRLGRTFADSLTGLITGRHPADEPKPEKKKE